MIHKIDEETIDFLAEKKLSFNQFAICLFIFHKDDKNIIKLIDQTGVTMGETWIKKEGGDWIKEIDDLIKRGFLVRFGGDDKWKYHIGNFYVTPEFTDGFLIGEDDAADELWAEYPAFGLWGVGGTEPMSSKICDFDDFNDKYTKAIKGDLKLHRSIIDKVKAYNLSHEYADMKIMNFVGSRQWENMTGKDESKRTRSY